MIIRYFKRIISKCEDLSKTYNYPLIYFLMDMMQARLFYGCNLDEYIQGKVFKMKLFERKDFISYKRAEKLMNIFNKPNDSSILADKVQFLKVFAKWVKRDWLDCRSASKKEIMSFVEKHERVIAKPIFGMKGEGVCLINCKDATPESLSQFSNNNFLIEECIKQHEAMVFGGQSLNTIRIYTLVNKDGVPKIIKAIQRAGVGETLVDNFHQGGIIYPIDIETGIIEQRGVKTDFEKQYMFHPGTNICMLGYQIPHWEKVKQLVLQAAVILPQARYVGWDVAVLKDEAELIEGNEAADFKLITHIGKPYGYHDFLNAK